MQPYGSGSPGWQPGYGSAPDAGGPYGPYPTMLPAELEFNADDPIPDGYHVATRLRGGLVAGGAATLGSTWLISVVVAGASVGSGNSSAAPLFAPIAGPFVTMATLETSDSGAIRLAGLAIVALAIDGAAQLTGAALLVAGLTARQKYLLRNDTTVSHPLVVPLVRPGMAGMGLVGAF